MTTLNRMLSQIRVKIDTMLDIAQDESFLREYEEASRLCLAMKQLELANDMLPSLKIDINPPKYKSDSAVLYIEKRSFIDLIIPLMEAEALYYNRPDLRRSKESLENSQGSYYTYGKRLAIQLGHDKHMYTNSLVSTEFVFDEIVDTVQEHVIALFGSLNKYQEAMHGQKTRD